MIGMMMDKWLPRLLLFLTICLQTALTEKESIPYTNCRITMKEPKGVITTPNFPNPYPVPINCQWVIEAPADKVIVVYFTQFYMREGLKATEYAYYSHNVKMGKTEFGTISSEREPTYLVSNKPVLVLDFTVREMSNIHMRVREFLLDVFGFNITYEIIARNESVRKEACLYHHCSFTGNCFASSTFDRYYCNCFAKYFGDECQYDLDCGPTASRSMCQNGGTCRYYIGSTVRTCECPPGYDGARCEKRKSGKPLLGGCSGDSCDISCSSEDNTLSGKTCTRKKEKHRYVILLKLTNPKVNSILSDKKKKHNFKKEMEKDLQLLFKTRLELYENITVLEFRTDSVMKFHMLATSTDLEELKSTIEGMLKVGKLGIFDFDQDFFELKVEPALNIDKIEASEKMPVIEGQELTLACMVKGSDSLQVEWMKDNIPVYVHTAQRGMWTTVVPKNSQQQYTALLGFDKVSNIDSGVFTCQVTDWGFVQNKSIKIEVQSSPQPQLNPMTASIFREDQLVITCLSREDLYGTFGYTWLKNGQIINPSNEPEMIEDLFPAGSRILLRKAKSSATYTCIITSSAGSTRKDSVITVLNREKSIPSCPPEDYMKVWWTLAASNTKDRQLCPVGYTGDVSRSCSLSSSKGAFWEEPDFSGCFSNAFLSIKKKVDSLKLGYLLTDVTTLLLKVKRYLVSKRLKLHVCEGEPIIDILEDIHKIEHAERYSREGWQAFLDIVSILLESPRLIRKHSKIIKLHEQVFKYAFEYAENTNDVGFESFKKKYIAVELGKIPEGGDRSLKFPIQRFSRSFKYSEESPDLSPWASNSIEFNLNHWELETVDDGNSTNAVAVVFYKNLSPYFPQRFVSKVELMDVEYQLISSLVEVRIRGQSLKEDAQVNVQVQLENFNYTADGKHNGWNISCAMADFSHRRIQFVTTGCQLMWTIKNITLCDCHRLGTYALLLTHYSRPVEVHIRQGFDTIVGAGCSICAFFLLITILILLSAWRRIRGTVIAFKLQVCVALLGAYVTIFCGLNYSLSEVFYPYIITVIQFFLLASFSLQLCLALIVYIECIDLKNIHFSAVKIAAMGWTLPLIILGATLSAQSLDGFKLKGWWLTLGSTFFYAYTPSIVILTMFQILLFLTVKSEIRNHGKVADFLQKKKARVNNSRMKLLHRSMLLTATLLLVSIASILYINFENRFFKYFFATTSAWLGFVVFLAYTFCSENHFILCCSEEPTNGEIEQESSSLTSHNNSFKSFLKPEFIDDTYTSKLSLDAEKRNERIRRMYSQIERSSLVKSGMDPYISPCVEASTELLPHQHHTPSHRPHPPDVSLEASQRPVVLSDGSATNSPSKISQAGDTFCNVRQDSSAYPKMQWRYANHPHGYTGSPADHSRHDVQRPLLLPSDTDPCTSVDYDDYMQRSQHQDLSQSLYQHPQTIQADVVASAKSQIFSFADVADVQGASDSMNDRNSCFGHHTDSLETVVYCEDVRGDGDGAKHSQSWNMTSV